ncbi:MAG: ABC transporter permease [Acidobacteria bacterium]|nr:ABC transporter permease [Acidobacteriota bacterium]
MNPSLLLRTVLLRFWRYKSKTIFMGLGITVGVLATVVLQTAAGSVRGAFSSFIERSYPADSVVLVAGSGFMGGGLGRDNLRLADVETVANTLGIKEWDPIVQIGLQEVKRGGNNVRVTVSGCSERAESVRRRSAQDGEFFTADEIKSRANVALIGPTTAKTLFPGESPLGEKIFINNVPFQVKGILEPVGVDPHGNDQDNAIEVPYTTLINTFRITAISGATFIAGDRSHVEEARNEIIRVMREQHQIGEGQKDDFSVITSALMQNLLDIMQISIKARTPEIGLRKAMGARSRDLQTQIVLEVLIVSVVASLLGLLLSQVGIALVAPVLAAKFGVKHVSAPVLLLVVAVLAAMATGLVGGILPARRAAKLNPIAALK